MTTDRHEPATTATEPTTDRDPHAVIVAALKAKAVRIAPPLPTLGIHDIDGAATAVVAALGLHAWTPPTPGTDDTRAGHGMMPGSHERPDGPEDRRDHTGGPRWPVT